MYYNKVDLQKIFGFRWDKMKRFLDKGISPTTQQLGARHHIHVIFMQILMQMIL